MNDLQIDKAGKWKDILKSNLVPGSLSSASQWSSRQRRESLGTRLFETIKWSDYSVRH